MHKTVCAFESIEFEPSEACASYKWQLSTRNTARRFVVLTFDTKESKTTQGLLVARNLVAPYP